MTPRDDTDVPTLGGALEVLRLVWALDHALHRRSRRMQSEHGVTGPQRLAVRLIGRFPGVSAGGLAKLLHIHPSTLTGILTRLERRRLVVRRPDPADARRTLFALTAAGRAVDAKRDGTIEAVVAAALEHVSRTDLAAAERLLSALTAALAAPPRARRK